MKICVYGAGAVGGHLAGRLAARQTAVSVIARGEQLDAIREHGLRVETHDREHCSRIRSPPTKSSDLEPQDIVIVAVKAPTLPAIAKSIGVPAAPGQPGALRHERHPLVVLPLPTAGLWTGPSSHDWILIGRSGNTSRPERAVGRGGLHRRQRGRAGGDPRREST